MSNPTTDREPVAITEAKAAVQTAELAVRDAKAELSTAQTAYAGVAEADADAVEQAVEAGKGLPAKLPSVALKARLDLATAQVTVLQRSLDRAKASLDETYRAADEWRAAELSVADQDEADFLALLDATAAALDRVKASRALAAWVATTTAGVPGPFAPESSAVGSSGDKIVAELVERRAAADHGNIAAAVRAAKRKGEASFAAQDAAAAAAEDRRQARHDEREAGEKRSQQRYLDSLLAKYAPKEA